MLSLTFQHAWEAIKDWSPYVLESFSNLLLGIAGIILSFPKLAEKIEDHPVKRRLIGGACIVFGLIGFSYDIYEKRTGDQDIRELIKNTQTLVANTSKTAQTTDKALDQINSLIPKVTTLTDRVIRYAASNEKAIRQGNKSLSSLSSQQTSLQLESEFVKRQYLLGIAQKLTDEIQQVHDQWKAQDTDSRHKYPRGRYDEQYYRDQAQFSQNYTGDLKDRLAKTDSVRSQLIASVPSAVQRQLAYPQVDEILQNVAAGQNIKLEDLDRVIYHLRKVIRILSELPPEHQMQAPAH